MFTGSLCACIGNTGQLSLHLVEQQCLQFSLRSVRHLPAACRSWYEALMEGSVAWGCIVHCIVWKSAVGHSTRGPGLCQAMLPIYSFCLQADDAM